MTHTAANDLLTLPEELLETAREASSGQAARTVYGDAHQTLHQVLIALVAGQGLAEHENPGQATVQVLRGSVELRAGSVVLKGGAGALLATPQEPHSVAALEDSVFLLTVAKLG